MLSLALMGLLPNKINITSGSIKLNGKEFSATFDKSLFDVGFWRVVVPKTHG